MSRRTESGMRPYLDTEQGERAVVFLHGIGGGASGWRRQLDALAEAYRCIAWNAPGYEGAPPAAPFDWDSLSDSLDALADGLGLARFALVGHSMGGMVAQHYVARRPERVAALVLAGTSPAFGRSDGDWQRQFVSDRLAPLDAGRSMAELAPDIVAALVGAAPSREGVAAAVACMSAVPPETYRAAVRNLVTFDGRASLPAIGAPTLVLAFGEDGNAPAPMMRRMAEKIPGAVYRCIPHAGHLASFERPEAFNRALAEFLDGVDAARWS